MRYLLRRAFQSTFLALFSHALSPMLVDASTSIPNSTTNSTFSDQSTFELENVPSQVDLTYDEEVCTQENYSQNSNCNEGKQEISSDSIDSLQSSLIAQEASTSHSIPKTQPIQFDQIRFSFFYSQSNQEEFRLSLQSAARFQLPEKSFFLIKPRYNYLSEKNFDPISSSSISVSWEKYQDRWSYIVGGGFEIFDENNTKLEIASQISYKLPLKIDNWRPISFLNLSTSLTQEPLRISKAINANITVLQLKPQLWWRINPNTDLIGSLSFNFFSDENTSLNPSLRLTRQLFDQFTVGVVTSSTTHSAPNISNRKGYQTQDISEYGVILGWKQEFSKTFDCNVSTLLRRIEFHNSIDRDISAQTYHAGCKYYPSKDFEFSLGYEYSSNNQDNILINGIGDEGERKNTNIIMGQFLFNF